VLVFGAQGGFLAHVFYAEAFNLERYDRQILQQLYGQLTGEEQICEHFEQDSATAAHSVIFTASLFTLITGLITHTGY
jgi:hypothetical protein